MGWFAAFALENTDEIIDGDEVGSTAGWAAFGDWASDLDGDYPELGYLGEHGECHPEESLSALESELQKAIAEKPGDPSEDVLHVAERLLSIVRDRPDEVAGMVITDGTEGDDEEGDDSESDDSPHEGDGQKGTYRMRYSSYKLAGDQYALDAPAGAVEIDQGKMSAGCVFAVDTLDRVGDILNIAGIRTENHRRNPQVLFNHKADSLDDAVGLTQDPDGNYTVVLREHDAYQTTYFCQNNLLAEQLYDRIVAGQIRANSIGYRTLKSRKNSAGGKFLDEVELVEISWVVVPANQDALRSCLSRDRLCGKALHPSLRAAFQAQLQANTRMVVPVGSLLMKKLGEKKAAEAKTAPTQGKAETPLPPPPPAPAAEQAPAQMPHGAEMLTTLHAKLSEIATFANDHLPRLENEAVEAEILDLCEGVLGTAASIEALFQKEYPDLDPLGPLAPQESSETTEEPADEGKDETAAEEVAEEAGEEKGREDEEVPTEEGKSAPVSGKDYSGEGKRLTKAMGGVIRECSEHLAEMKDAENLTSGQRLVCKHYAAELGAMVKEDEPATPDDDGGEVDEIEKEYDSLTPEEQKAFDLELRLLLDKQDAADRRAALTR